MLSKETMPFALLHLTRLMKTSSKEDSEALRNIVLSDNSKKEISFNSQKLLVYTKYLDFIIQLNKTQSKWNKNKLSFFCSFPFFSAFPFFTLLLPFLLLLSFKFFSPYLLFKFVFSGDKYLMELLIDDGILKIVHGSSSIKQQNFLRKALFMEKLVDLLDQSISSEKVHSSFHFLSFFCFYFFVLFCFSNFFLA